MVCYRGCACGVGGGGEWAVEGGLRLPLRQKSHAVCSVGDKNSLGPQDRPRQLLATVWHHTHPY